MEKDFSCWSIKFRISRKPYPPPAAGRSSSSTWGTTEFPAVSSPGSPKLIPGNWVEFPERIQRDQKRKFFRLRAPSGTEIFFPGGAGAEEKGTVKDYSVGGVAFLIDKEISLKPGDQLKNPRLCIPDGREVLKVPVPLAGVIRAEPDFFQGQTFYALEFLKLSEGVKKESTRHIFEKQRNLVRAVVK
jgi:c-di-GMP-binding flagellar brake protein YcgR